MTDVAARTPALGEVSEIAPDLLTGRDARRPGPRPETAIAGTGSPDLMRAPGPAPGALAPVRAVTAAVAPVTGNVREAASSAPATGYPRVASSARPGGRLDLAPAGPRKAAATAGIAMTSPVADGIQLVRTARLRAREPGPALASRRPGVRTTGRHAARAVVPRAAVPPGTGNPVPATAAGRGPRAGLAASAVRMAKDARMVRGARAASGAEMASDVRMASGLRVAHGAGMTTRAVVVTTGAGARTPVAATVLVAATTAGGIMTVARRARGSARSARTVGVPTPGVHVQMRRGGVLGQSPVRRFRTRSAHCSSTAMPRLS
jgi:hypothetical protein